MLDRKLGKLPAEEDGRTLSLSSVLAAGLPDVPKSFDYDRICGADIPTPMFANDNWGDCVIASRAHQTLRFEQFEQGKVLAITDRDVLRQYWREGGASCINPYPDKGLVLLSSLKRWRKSGWCAAGQKHYIYAFAAVHPADRDEIRAAVYLLRGINVGLRLPKSAKTQEVWDVAAGPDAVPGSWGGHCVPLFAYDDIGPTCVTWGARQKMTWAFFASYCDEAFAIVDARDRWLGDNSPLEVEKLDGYLKAVTG